MAKRISPTIKRLLEERKLLRAKFEKDVIDKELEASEYDFKKGHHII
jgi:hypothetical protein